MSEDAVADAELERASAAAESAPPPVDGQGLVDQHALESIATAKLGENAEANAERLTKINRSLLEKALATERKILAAKQAGKLVDMNAARYACDAYWQTIARFIRTLAKQHRDRVGKAVGVPAATTEKILDCTTERLHGILNQAAAELRKRADRLWEKANIERAKEGKPPYKRPEKG